MRDEFKEKAFVLSRSALIVAFGLLLTLSPGFAQTTPFPEWKPPSPRLKVKTPFAPKARKGHNIFTGDAEKWLADEIYSPTDLLDDAQVVEYVNRVGQNLVPYSSEPDRRFEFFVTPGIGPNACTPGCGRVYVTTGLLQFVENEDELAGVLAHEMGHDAMRHTPKTLTRQLFWMTGIKKVGSAGDVQAALEKLYRKYDSNKVASFFEALSGISRDDEIEADRCAFYTIHKAGYNPAAYAVVLKRLEKMSKSMLGKGYTKRQFYEFWLGSHPLTGQRMAGLDWESRFVDLPPRDARIHGPAFDAMKKRL